MVAGPSLITTQQTTVAAPQPGYQHDLVISIFHTNSFLSPYACAAHHTKISSFSSLLPRATSLKHSLLWDISSRMKTVTLTEQKLELDIPSLPWNSLTCSLLCSVLHSRAEFVFALPECLRRIIDHYMGSKHDRNKCTTIKKSIFSNMKTNSNTQVYFSKIP